MSVYPAISELACSAQAVVETSRPARYAKQLISHMCHKVPCEEIVDGHRITFNREGIFSGYGDVLVTDIAGETKLVLWAYAEDKERLERVKGVLIRHLERFGEREGLSAHFSV
ncbi:DUF2218 domain-containing protein [Rothia sp. P13129]|uniref:DUF2218 domain-containing protein n=1 Tax=Rothia sp. P13129 TaxID=3402664 RepID=UPI003ACCA288